MELISYLYVRPGEHIPHLLTANLPVCLGTWNFGNFEYKSGRFLLQNYIICKYSRVWLC